MNVRIKFYGEQGSGKTRLQRQVEDLLKEKNFNYTSSDDLHTIDVIDPLETFNKGKT